MNSISPSAAISNATSRLNGPAAGHVVDDDELQSTFQKTVAGLFFGELMKSLRSTTGEPAYIHGGQAEKLFESQLDQVLVEDLSATKGAAFVGDLYKQFRVQLRLPPEPAGNVEPSLLDDRLSIAQKTRDRTPVESTLSAAVAEPANSPQSVSLAQSELSSRPLDVLEAARQARTVAERFSATTPTAVLSGLFRK